MFVTPVKPIDFNLPAAATDIEIVCETCTSESTAYVASECELGFGALQQIGGFHLQPTPNLGHWTVPLASLAPGDYVLCLDLDGESGRLMPGETGVRVHLSA